MVKGDRAYFIVLVLFVVACVIGAVTVAYAGRTFHLDDTHVSIDVPRSYSTGWYDVLTGASVTGDAAPRETSDGWSISISNVIPADVEPGSVFCMYTNWQSVRIYLEGRQFASYATDNRSSFGSLFGKVWLFVPLPDDAGGKELTLEISSKYEEIKVGLTRMFIGDRNAIAFVMLQKNLLAVLFFSLTGLLGLLCLLVALWQVRSHRRYGQGSFFFLGLFFLLSSVWVITDSSVLQFVSGNSAIGSLISVFVFILLPLPLLLFARSVYRNHGKLLVWFCFADLMLFFTIYILYVSNLVDFSICLPFVHVFMILVSAVLIGTGLREKIRFKNDAAFALVVGCSILSVSIVISLWMIYSQIIQWYLMIVMAGLFCFEFVLIVDLGRRFLMMMNEQAKVEVYKKLAYSDFLTMLGNRAAFDDALRLAYASSRSAGGPSALLIFDLNELKRWNDQAGHSYGDLLLRDAATLLRTVFSPAGESFRIGGDEFAVILRNCTLEKASGLLAELERKMDEYRAKTGKELVLAYGLAMSRDEHGRPYASSLEWFKVADERMYAEKLKTKAMTRS